jgi:hypothetical protein
MHPISNGITGAIQSFLEKHGGDVYATIAVLVAISVIAVVGMVRRGCKKGPNDDTVTRF